ncbi:KIAA1147 [Cordylochernes scorpioides]|uniref:DENN domain-containing protein 11 n=1 Tax=Cordylochernes scorpioides TaxID=51811 RepID=A0ABY6L4M2_9ARAC|nr:KIAA1147 [Cordylochernes scorpioides]
MDVLSYFKKEEYYGYACFESMQVNTDNERGIRMKSLGIMGHSYIQLPKFHTFLAKQLKSESFLLILRIALCHYDKSAIANLEDMSRKILEKPRYYEELVTFYLNAIKKNGDLSKYSSLSDVKVNGPGASFGHFVNFFGENVMLLWKVALLRKRILFFSPPPIGVVCYRVYSTCCLVFHDEQEFSKNLLTPLFYVNVADIPLLGIEKSFVACTTEKIFETKPHLYDAYVDNQNLVLISPQLKKILNINRADRHRFSELCKFRQEFILPSLSSCDRVNADIDDGFNWFKVYFMHTNNILLSTLLNVSRSPNRLWTREHMELTNLDPVHDRAFVEQLAVTYGLDIMVAGCGDALWDSTCSRLCCAAT